MRSMRDRPIGPVRAIEWRAGCGKRQRAGRGMRTGRRRLRAAQPPRGMRVGPMAARESSDVSFYAPMRKPAAHALGRYFEIASSATPFVRGPISPIAAITTAIAPAMNTNTPAVPKPFSTAAITNDVKIAEKRLHE